MKRFSAIVVALLTLSPLLAKEYPTRKELFANTGTKEVNKRNWTHSDRTSNSETWKEASLFNFSYATGFEEYKTVEQRIDFLTWLSLELKRKGHEVKWVDMVITVGELIKPAAKGDDNVSLFANLGNKLVFDSTFTRLQDLYHMEKPLKGAEARAWDEAMIQFEQEQLVQPIFNRMDIVTLEKVTKMAKGEGIYSLYTKKRLRFTGDLRNLTDRINFAEQALLPYVNEKVSADLQATIASENIIAEDGKSMRAAERYLKRLEKENTTAAPAKTEKTDTLKEPKVKKVKEVKVKEPKPEKVKKTKMKDIQMEAKPQ
ncbi:MAG: hypothetical protein V4616_00110 [Bacteroidota bacterium]